MYLVLNTIARNGGYVSGGGAASLDSGMDKTRGADALPPPVVPVRLNSLALPCRALTMFS